MASLSSLVMGLVRVDDELDCILDFLVGGGASVFVFEKSAVNCDASRLRFLIGDDDDDDDDAGNSSCLSEEYSERGEDGGKGMERVVVDKRA